MPRRTKEKPFKHFDPEEEEEEVVWEDYEDYEEDEALPLKTKQYATSKSDSKDTSREVRS